MGKSKSGKLQEVRGKLASKKSKTGDPACSQAMSDWKTSGMTPAIGAILGKCRSKARTQKQAQAQRNAGNEGKAQVLEKRADRGLTAKDRLATARKLIAERKAALAQKQAAKAPAAAAAPMPPRDSAGAASRLRDRAASLAAKTKKASGGPGDTWNQRQSNIDNFRRSEKLGAVAKQADGLTAKKPEMAAPKPTPTRSPKGDRATRLKALSEKAMGLAAKHGTRANSLTGAAEDRAVSAMQHHADRFYKLDAARAGKPTAAAPSKPSLKDQVAAKRAQKGSREDRVAKLKERLSAGFDKRYDRAFAAAEKYKGDANMVTLGALREKLGKRYDDSTFKAGINNLRRSGKVSLDSYEGMHGPLPQRDRNAALSENGTKYAFASYREGPPKSATAKPKAPIARAPKPPREERVKAILSRAQKIHEKLGRRMDMQVNGKEKHIEQRSFANFDRGRKVAASVGQKFTAAPAVPARQATTDVSKRPLNNYNVTLKEQAAAHRAKKEAPFGGVPERSQRARLLAAKAHKLAQRARTNARANSTKNPAKAVKYTQRATGNFQRVEKLLTTTGSNARWVQNTAR